MRKCLSPFSFQSSVVSLWYQFNRIRAYDMTSKDSFYIERFSTLDPEILLTTSQVAVILNTTTQELANQRSAGYGFKIPFVKIGESKNSSVRYRVGDVRDFIKSNIKENTHSLEVKNYEDFLKQASFSDEWIVVDLETNLKCFFESLKSGEEFEPVKLTRLEIQKRIVEIESMRLMYYEAQKEKEDMLKKL